MFVQRCQPLPAPMARSHHCCSRSCCCPTAQELRSTPPALCFVSVTTSLRSSPPQRQLRLQAQLCAAPNAPLPSSPCLSSAKQNGWNQSELREGGGARGSGPIRTAERNGGGGDCWRWARICDSSTAAGGSSRTKPTWTEPPRPPQHLAGSRSRGVRRTTLQRKHNVESQQEVLKVKAKIIGFKKRNPAHFSALFGCCFLLLEVRTLNPQSPLMGP